MSVVASARVRESKFHVVGDAEVIEAVFKVRVSVEVSPRVVFPCDLNVPPMSSVYEGVVSFTPTALF